MNRITLAFFAVAPVYGLIGMVWGIHMGMTEDHSMMPAHAHLNLLGLVVNGVMGAFYGLSGKQNKIAWANFYLWNLGVIIMIPTLALILQSTGAPAASLLAAITGGEVLAVLGMLLFGVNVWTAFKKTA